MEIQELRKSERFVAVERVEGSFGASEVALINISLLGVQVAHAQPLRLGTHARLILHRGDVLISAHCRLVWSHLSREADEHGTFLYRSGLKVDAVDTGYAAAINALFVRGAIARDPDSLERKKERMAERERQRKSGPYILTPTDPKE